DAGQPGTTAGARRVSPDDEDGPSLGDAGPLGGPLDRADRHALAGGPLTVAQVVIPQAPGSSSEAGMPDMGALAGGMDGVGPMAREATAGLAVEIDAVEGPGGLAGQYTADVGVPSRQASEDSLQISATPARFLRQQVGGTPDFSTAAVVAAEPFRGRMARRPGNTPGGAGGSSGPETEESIERGLAFLARYQQPDGSWTLKGFGEEVALASDTAATGLCLLAFQGAGYTHKEFQYAPVVRGGIEFLVKNQKEDGDLFVPLDENSNRSVWLYSHAIAAIALCEAYGMTQDPALREPAQKALNFIVASQHTDRGGWRYAPNYGSDTSVTGWMMMALKSGELANLEVSSDCYQKIEQWLDRSQASDRERHLYRYNPYAPDTPTQRHGRDATTTMTAVGLLMRLYTGWQRDNQDLVAGAEYLKTNLPAIGTPRDPQRDTYYWYYATQVMFHMGGEYWSAWHGRLHPLLVDQQVRRGPLAGSWEPRGPVPDRWAPHAGRLYVTTMNLLSLEVSYRHLPLYEETGK
ncbi:MAG: terpene cyclase/mutase family protein, partial [Pirellulaceae bacterium]|nr:terpene cyclase/mutase family protein [Pirellulaceae bacterium]